MVKGHHARNIHLEVIGVGHEKPIVHFWERPEAVNPTAGSLTLYGNGFAYCHWLPSIPLPRPALLPNRPLGPISATLGAKSASTTGLS